LTKTYHSPHRKIEWLPNSQGLCVFLHGLRGHPSIWDDHLAEMSKHPEIDAFVPHIPQDGECTLEEAAVPLYAFVKDYAEKHPKKPICLIGMSNGSRIATWIETEMRKEIPGTAVKVSTIAGLHFGSSNLAILENLRIAGWIMHDKNREELAYGSAKAQELLSRVLEPLPDGAAERDYEFYAASEDLYVDPGSAAPCINKNERVHLRHGYGHHTIVSAVAQHQILSCTDWIQKHQNRSI
jgi:hypothetical protein